MENLENKLNGFGKELALWEMRYLKESQELQQKVAVLETLVGNLQVRITETEKYIDNLETSAKEISKAIYEKNEKKVATKSWYDFLMKK